MTWFRRRPETRADSIDTFATYYAELVRHAAAYGVDERVMFRKTLMAMAKAGMSYVEIIDTVEAWVEETRPRDGHSVIAALAMKHDGPRPNPLLAIQAEFDARPRPRRQPGLQPNPQAHDGLVDLLLSH
jgi:hypothetical protein